MGGRKPATTAVQSSLTPRSPASFPSAYSVRPSFIPPSKSTLSLGLDRGLADSGRRGSASAHQVIDTYGGGDDGEHDAMRRRRGRHGLRSTLSLQGCVATSIPGPRRGVGRDSMEAPRSDIAPVLAVHNGKESSTVKLGGPPAARMKETYGYVDRRRKGANLLLLLSPIHCPDAQSPLAPPRR